MFAAEVAGTGACTRACATAALGKRGTVTATARHGLVPVCRCVGSRAARRAKKASIRAAVAEDLRFGTEAPKALPVHTGGTPSRGILF